VPDFVQYALFMGCAALLFLLRVDGRRFRAAEWDDDAGGRRVWAMRAAWYILGIALVLLVFTLHPQPITRLHIDPGDDRGLALALGLLYGAAGTAAAFLVAWLRYGHLRLPSARGYPAALLTSIGTAVIDEVLFRGVLLGILLEANFQSWFAVLAAAVTYAVTIRAAGGALGPLMPALILGVGVVSGTLVLVTHGIGAGIVGLAITRFALYLSTGHRGRVRPPGYEVEEILSSTLPPPGWGMVEAPGELAGPARIGPGWGPGRRPGERARPPRLGPGWGPGRRPDERARPPRLGPG
jgi:hypothetical protein